MLRSKRNLTQSEKHKQFVEGCQALDSFSLKNASSLSLEYLECPQNVIYSRKCAVLCDALDKAKSKSIARINGEKHLLKLKYKGLIKDDEDGDITRTFFLQPGFRFHNNGDIRKVKDPRTVSESSFDRRKSALSVVRSDAFKSKESLCHKLSSVSLKNTHSQNSLSGHGDGPNKTNVDEAIKQIEKDLEHIKSDKDLIEINRKISEVRGSLKFVRAHANDFKPDVKYISVNSDDQGKFLRQLRDHDVGEHSAIHDKLSRHCTRINCVACEFRLKCGIEKRQNGDADKHLKRWENAPRGSYVSRLDENNSRRPSQYEKRPKTIKSAKHHDELATSQSAAIQRSSKSASTNTVRQQRCNPKWERAKRIKKLEQAYGLVDKFKERENICKTSTSQIEKKTPVSDISDIKISSNLSEGACNNVDSEQVIKVQEIHSFIENDHYDALDDNGIYTSMQKNEEEKSVEPEEDTSLISVINKAVMKEKEVTQKKIHNFYDKLPSVKPVIHTWRNSSGQLNKWKPQTQTDKNQTHTASDLTWAQYHKNNSKSLEHEVQYKIYMSSQEKLSGDPNSIEELSKCRYLRQFKMRKNLPVK